MPDTTILPPPKPQRGMVIRGLTPRLPERGKIKIGGLGQQRKAQSSDRTYQLPVKYDHFVVTTLERGQDGNFRRDDAMHERIGDRPTRLPIRLLYDDPTLNFPTRYACYKGRTLWCAGDGHKATRLDESSRERFEVSCTCPLADPTIKRGPTDMRCKMNGALSVLLDGASGLGGVWTFRTTSYNSIVGLLSTMAFIRQITGGPLANIPLLLTVQGKQAANPVDGSAVHIFIVGLEFDGSVSDLQGIGHQIALDRARTHLSIEHIEDEARRHLLMLPTNAPLPGDDDGVVDEFYPEQAATERMAGDGPMPPRPVRADFEASAEVRSPPNGDDAGDTEGDEGDLPNHVLQREEPEDESGAEEQQGEPERDEAFWAGSKLFIPPHKAGDRADWRQTEMDIRYRLGEARSATEVDRLLADSKRTVDSVKLFDKALGAELLAFAAERKAQLGVG